MNGRLRGGGITTVTAPDRHGDWTEMTSKEDIERGCLWENERRFKQTENTPFMTAPLVDEFGCLGVGANADRVSRGEHQPPEGTDPCTAMLLQQLKMDPAVASAPPVKTGFTTQEHTEGWKKVKERTSSGPSGTHFGHFAAGCNNPIASDFEATMANIPHATGHSPKRWRHRTNVMLPKKSGSLRADKLRTVLSYEADFNHNNKMLGRDVMCDAETHDQVAQEQHGSRKNLAAVEHALNKRTHF